MLILISMWDVMIRTDNLEFMDFSGLQLKPSSDFVLDMAKRSS